MKSWKLGSPPHRRGKGIQADGAGAWAGITPAQAGKRTSRSCGPRGYGDHPRIGGEKRPLFLLGLQLFQDYPRAGGEKFPSITGTRWAKGSPPRRRGKGVDVAVSDALVGITPAQAGKSEATASTTTSRRDHPRAGGEKFTILNVIEGEIGSPPRGRGKGVLDSNGLQDPGITPAWAGKSRWRFSGRLWSWDHPRVGGEKSIQAEEEKNELGSPPRGRGKD